MRTDVIGVQENDIGFIIDKRFWGHGYATEAARVCLRYGIETLKMKRIVASMETKHLASRAVAEKIGLRFEKEFINSRNRDLPTNLLSIETDR
jgi:RimJ/RimL family protein N-acetyltransferase